MSATAHAATAGSHELEESKFQIYVQIAMLLAVITGIEIITVYLPFAVPILFAILVVFSAVKFLFVIFFFMHLRWDRPFCTILFFIGLILGGGTMWALLRLFGAEASLPLSSAMLETVRSVAAA
jgi:cytochrome c oxidase subunit 4